MKASLEKGRTERWIIGSNDPLQILDAGERTRTPVVLAIALFRFAEWFFGNAYEQVVIVPNLLWGDPLIKLASFRTFFATSNPIYFYVPVLPFTILAQATALYLAWRDPAQRRRPLTSTGFLVAALALAVFIVVYINLYIFFGPLPTDANVVHRLVLLWTCLNPIRMALVASAFAFARAAWPANVSDRRTPPRPDASTLARC